MMNHDEMFEYVHSKYKERLQQKKRRSRLVRQAALAGMCLAVVIGAGVRNRLGTIETVPETPPVPETTAETAESESTRASAAISTTTGTVPVTSTRQTTTTTAQTQPSASATTQTTHRTETQSVTSATVQTEVSSTASQAEIMTTAWETKAVQPISETAAPVTSEITESTAAVHATETGTKAQPPKGYHGVEDETGSREATEPVLPEFPGFEVTWDADNSRYWHVRWLASVTASPETDISYTVPDDHFIQKLRQVGQEASKWVAYYTFQCRESKEWIEVYQYRRDTFAFTCPQLRAPESGQIGEYPYIMGKTGSKTVLYWDDGCYMFRMYGYTDDRALLKTLVQSMIQEQPSS